MKRSLLLLLSLFFLFLDHGHAMDIRIPNTEDPLDSKNGDESGNDNIRDSTEAKKEAAQRYSEEKEAEALASQNRIQGNTLIPTGWPINFEGDKSSSTKEETSEFEDPKGLSEKNPLNATILTKKPIWQVETGPHASQAERLGLKAEQSLPSTNFRTPQGVEITSMFLKDPEKIKKSYENEYQERLLEEKGKLDQPELKNLLTQWEQGMNIWLSISLLELKEEAYSKMKELAPKMPPSCSNLISLLDAMKIMDDAISYRNSFLEEQKRIEINSTNQKQPFIQFSKAINERNKTVNKNLQKLINTAEEVKALYATKSDCLEQAAKSVSPLKEQWNEAAEKIDLAIKSRLLYAEKMKIGSLKEAKKTRIAGEIFRATALENTYRLKAAQARAAGDLERAKNLQKAADAASKAASYFAKAAEEGISQEERSALMQVGVYSSEAAQAHAAGELKRANNLENAADAEDSAAIYFAKAAQEGISEEERSAWMQAGSYWLEAAQAHAAGELERAENLKRVAHAASEAAYYFAYAAKEGISKEERKAYLQAVFYSSEAAQALAAGELERANNLGRAAKATSFAADHFAYAAKEGISEEERKAYLQAGSYKLEEAQARAAGELEQANNLENAAEAASWAAWDYFAQAAKEGISKEARKAYLEAGSYKLEAAKAHAAGELEQANNLARAARAASKAASDYFALAAQEGISEGERSALMQACSYKLEAAQAHAAGELERVRNLKRAANAASDAAYYFAQAAQEGISEEERKAYLQVGSYGLEKAQALAAGELERAYDLERAALAVRAARIYFSNASFFNNNQSEGSYRLKLGQLWASGQRKRAEGFTYERYLEEESSKANQKLNTLIRNTDRIWKGLP